MSWRSNLINSMTGRERMTLLGLIAGGRPDAFDWAAERLGGEFAERFSQARPAGELPAAAPEPQSRRCLIPAEHGMSRCWCADPGHNPDAVAALLADGHTFAWERDVTGGWFALVRNAEGFITETGLGPSKAAALAHLAERLERAAQGRTGLPGGAA